MKTTLILSIMLTALCLVHGASAQDDSNGLVRQSTEKVLNLTSNGPAIVPAARSMISRHNNEFFWNITTGSLPPGEVVTLWVPIFNNPQFCDQVVPGCEAADLKNALVNGSLHYGGGTIVGDNGRANFSGRLGIGDATGSFISFPGTGMPDPAPGLVNTEGAEIHLVIRKHGPASSDPATLQAQLTSFGGGCTVAGACANIQASVHRP